MLKHNKEKHLLIGTPLDESEHGERLIVHNNFEQEQTQSDFLGFLYEEMDIWHDVEEMKEGEKKVLIALKGMLQNPEILEIYNKKAVFVYLREITGLNTKQITAHILAIKNKYIDFKKSWDNEIY